MPVRPQRSRRVLDSATDTPVVRLAILGPTCSRKSAIAMRLAELLDAEIISCDSMQVYRGLDIGTAKPTAADRLRVPHHLIDALDIAEPYNVSRFLAKCEEILTAPGNRTKPYLLVGGSGLYARALVYGYRLAPVDPALNAQLWEEYRSADGPARLSAELAAAAPRMASRLNGNPRRLVRAVEIQRITGRADVLFAGANRETAAARQRLAWRQFIILPPWEIQRRAIAERTEAMLRAGWIAETAALVAGGLEHAPTARQAIGYRDIAAYLRGELADRGQLAAFIVRHTVCYARRQRTWFRHQHPGAEFLEGFFADAEEGAARILASVRAAAVARPEIYSAKGYNT